MNKNILNEISSEVLKSYIAKAKEQEPTLRKASKTAFERANLQWEVPHNVRLALKYKAKADRRQRGIGLAKSLLREQLIQKLDEAKKKATAKSKPVQPNTWAGVKRGLIVTGEGLGTMRASAGHAATGVKMIAKHLARGVGRQIGPTVAKHPVKSLIAAGLLGGALTYGGIKAYDTLTSASSSAKKGVPSGSNVGMDFTTHPNLQWKRRIQEAYNKKMKQKKKSW